jgi:predicted Zn-dependent protease
MSMPSDTSVYEGKLSDGRTAASIVVDVRFGEEALEIRPAGQETGAPLLWPYGSLRSSVPLRADAPDVLVCLKPSGAQTLYVTNRAFSGSLRARAPELSPNRQRLLGLRTGAVVSAVVAVIVAAIWTFDYEPMQAAARLMPQQVREKMGRNVVRALTGSMRVCETAPGRAALDRLAGRLMAAASDTSMPHRVILVDWGIANAFAAPGGQLVLTRGLVQTATSSDEVAGVLAHEIGHALELHPETGMIRAMALGFAAELVFAGSSNTANFGVILTQLRYSRAAEREADAHAVRILKNAGVSPKGFGDFFERIDPLVRLAKGKDKDKEGAKETDRVMRTLQILSTHPLTDERIKMVRSQPDYPTTPALSDDDWRALREMCGRGASSTSPQPGSSAGDSQGDRR